MGSSLVRLVSQFYARLRLAPDILSLVTKNVCKEMTHASSILGIRCQAGQGSRELTLGLYVYRAAKSPPAGGSNTSSAILVRLTLIRQELTEWE